MALTVFNSKLQKDSFKQKAPVKASTTAIIHFSTLLIHEFNCFKEVRDIFIFIIFVPRGRGVGGKG